MERAEAIRWIAELEAGRLELELQNERLSVAQRGISEARDRFADLYHHAPVGYAVLDERGVVLRVNARLSEMLRRPWQWLADQRLADLVRADDQDAYFLNLRWVLKTQGCRTQALGLVRRGGDHVEVRSTWCLTSSDADEPATLRVTFNEID